MKDILVITIGTAIFTTSWVVVWWQYKTGRATKRMFLALPPLGIFFAVVSFSFLGDGFWSGVLIGFIAALILFFAFFVLSLTVYKNDFIDPKALKDPEKVERNRQGIKKRRSEGYYLDRYIFKSIKEKLKSKG